MGKSEDVLKEQVIDMKNTTLDGKFRGDNAQIGLWKMTTKGVGSLFHFKF